jgi:hypothetical protein
LIFSFTASPHFLFDFLLFFYSTPCGLKRQ